MPGEKDRMRSARPARSGRVTTRGNRAGFTLVDVLVSMAVIAVLIALLAPSLANVREATRRVVCGSNVRQHGLGLAMYADDWKGLLPPSRFMPKTGSNNDGMSQPQQMVVVRDQWIGDQWDWDGLGILFQTGYLDAPGVFYCPSHSGDHPYWLYANVWSDDSRTQIVINYQYRGSIANLWAESATHDSTALLTDGMRVRSDYNHKVGANVLRADVSVFWFPDNSGSLVMSLPESLGDSSAPQKIDDAWNALDHGPQR